MAIAKACSCKFCMRSYRLPSLTLYCNSRRDSLLHCRLFFSFFPLLPSVLDNLGPSITCDPPIVVSLSRSSVKLKQWMIDRLLWLHIYSGTHCQLSYARSRSLARLNFNSRHLFGAAFYQQECEFHYSFSLQYCNYNFISNLDTALIIILYVTLLFR